MNPESDHDKLERMSKQVDEIYPIFLEIRDFLKASTITGKFVKWLVGFIAAAAVATWSVMRLIKGQSPF